MSLLAAIVERYMIGTYCLAVFGDPFQDLIVRDVPIIRFGTDALKSTILRSLDDGCSDYIITLEEPSVFLAEYPKAVLASLQRRPDRKLIFSPPKADARFRERLIDLFSLNATKLIPNILVILPNDCQDEGCSYYNLATHRYVGVSGHQDLVILDTWSEAYSRFENDTDLFANKINNLQGKTFVMSTFVFKPCSVFTVDENNNLLEYDGTEMRIIIELCKLMNCSLAVYLDEFQWGITYDNGTGNGIYGNVMMDKADVGLAGIFPWYHEYLSLDYSATVSRSGITCVAPEPLPLPIWLLPIVPFNNMLWTSVLVALVVGTTVIYFTGRAAIKPFTWIESTIMSLGILVLQVPSINNPPTQLRRVITYLVVLGLFLTTIYSSELSSAITVPKYYDPIDTVEQLDNSGIEWGADDIGWVGSILDTPNPKIQHLLSKYKNYPIKTLKAKGFTRDFAFCVERRLGGNLGIPDYVLEDAALGLQIMKEDIYWDLSILVLRKSSAFTAKVNTLLSRLKQSGLILQWESQMTATYMNYRVQQAIKTSLGKHGDDPGSIRPLGAKFLQGPFFLWSIGMAIAFGAFIVELAISKGVKMTCNTQLN